ncbi:PorT family protein [Dysgonomonas sp. OttesenSCG-928-M03]|nr:PorT family protein [Dysgonomonas sp. OttesenSCG-928-M03]
MIKKFFIFNIVLALCLHAVSAQSKFKGEWNIGVGFGPTFSNMSIVPTNLSKSLDTKNISQFHGGISVRYVSENHLGLWGELNYSQQGWERDFDNISVEGYEYTHKLTYLELPLLTHIYFGSKKFRVYVNLGPKFSYLLSEKETMSDKVAEDIKNENRIYIGTLDQYNRDVKNKIDYGIMAGLGVELRTGIGNFALEGRYYMGFGDIWNNNKSDPFSRSANRGLSARLTYFVKAF